MRDLDLPEVRGVNKIVLIGELTAGEPALLRAGQSVPLAEGSDLKFSIIEGLQIELTDVNNASEQLNGTPDNKTSVLYTIPFTGISDLQPGAHYRVKATHPALGTATTEFTVPGIFTAFVSDTSSATYAGLHVLKIKVRIQDRPDEKNYYVIDAVKQYIDVTGSFYYNNAWHDLNGNKRLYDSLVRSNVSFTTDFDTTLSDDHFRQPVYTTDANTENLVFGNSLNPSRRILLRDLSFSGNEYETEIMVDRSQFVATGLIDRGRIVVTVRSVSEEYYNYLVSYEQTQPGLDPDLPVRISGNISNGLGIIGAVYAHRIYYIFDSWGY